MKSERKKILPFLFNFILLILAALILLYGYLGIAMQGFSYPWTRSWCRIRLTDNPWINYSCFIIGVIVFSISFIIFLGQIVEILKEKSK